MPSAAQRRYRSLADLIARADGRPSGFDYLRLALALSVVGWHSLLVAYGPDVQAHALHSLWRLAVNPILPMFFALSGFLVAGSLQRNTVAAFLGLRVLRIVPALAVEVCLSGLLLGPLVTTLPLAEYFSDGKFIAYPLNIVGDIHYFLPGVFNDNPAPDFVNAQLWTIPFELQCYALLAGIALVGLRRAPGPLVCAVATLNLVWAGVAYVQSHGVVDNSTVAGPVLPLCFLAGVTVYALRDRMPVNRVLCLLALGLTLLGLTLPFGDYLIPFPVAYLTVAIGVQNPRRCRLVRWGDYSYGIYLYGFPIEQMAAHGGAAFHHWYMILAVAVPLTTALAAVSWNLVEKPILGLRHHVQALNAATDYGRDRLQCLGRAAFGPFGPRLQAAAAFAWPRRWRALEAPARLLGQADLSGRF